tara:strand:- start:390 stop:998 length:609 start_codon:yes stop_codon:yes gene_type:complete
MALTKVTGAGVGTVNNLIIADAGNIGSASDTDAIAISSGGVVTLSQSSQRAQTFVLQADQSGGGAEETLTNWGEQSGDYTRVGAANFTQSSGIFSSATTGTFLCLQQFSLSSGGSTDLFDLRLEISTDSGSNFTGRAVVLDVGNSGYAVSSHNLTIFTVSNTTTFRLRYRLGAMNTVATNNTIRGDANQAETAITFVKLGVI